MSDTEMNNIFGAYTRHKSLDTVIAESPSGNLTLMETFPVDEKTDENLMKTSLKIEVERSLSKLSPREKEVVEAYFGFNENGNTLDKLETKYNLTRERVRQIKERAVKKLQSKRTSSNLIPYLG